MKKIFIIFTMVLLMFSVSCDDYMEDLLFQSKLTEGLVAYWPVTETSGTAVKDYSGESPSLSPLTGFTFDSGKFSSALYCDGLNSSKAVYTGYDLLKGKNAFTISLWTKLHYDAVDGRFIALYLDNFSISYGEASPPNLNLSASVGDGSGSMIYVGGATMKAEEWTHIAVVFSGNELSIFINGEFVNKSSANIVLSRIDYFLFGGAYSESDPLNGFLDEIRIYNRALSMEEIEALMKIGVD